MSEFSLNLLGVEIPTVNQQKCEKAYEESIFRKITPRMLCAGFDEGEKDTCHENFTKFRFFFRRFRSTRYQSLTQIGIVSWSEGCAMPNYPSVFFRISEVRDWIFEYTGI